MFIAREKELQLLNKYYRKDSFELLILYGRRRVGKTSLLTEFIKGKKAIFFSAEENNDTLNLEKFSEIVLTYFGEEEFISAFKTWELAFRYVSKKVHEERLIIVIDELPYLVSGNPSFLSTLQHLIDHDLINKNIFLILSGSSISFIENEVIAHKSPIFGRKTGQLVVEPFDYFDVARFFEAYSYLEKLEAYGILGGVPLYLLKFDCRESIKENVIENILDIGAYLYDEPKNMMHQELRNPAVYNAIIEAIASGASRPNEIATKIGENVNKTHKYMQTLLELRIIVKIQPVDNKRGNKSIYRLKDNLFKFIYRFVYRYKSMVEQGLAEVVYTKKIETYFNEYMGGIFEDICLEYLIRKNREQKLPFIVEEFGTWWGNNSIEKRQEEIDIVGLGEDNVLYVECKYRNELVGKEVFEKLVYRSMFIKSPSKHYYIFSKSGFKKELIEIAKKDTRLTLIKSDELFRI